MLQVLRICESFLPSGAFYFTLIAHVWSMNATICFYQGFPGSQQFNLNDSRASCCCSKHSSGPTVCLNHTAIDKLNIQKILYFKQIAYDEKNIIKIVPSNCSFSKIKKKKKLKLLSQKRHYQNCFLKKDIIGIIHSKRHAAFIFNLIFVRIIRIVRSSIIYHIFVFSNI